MYRFTCLLTFLLYHVVSEKGRYVVIYVGCMLADLWNWGFLHFDMVNIFRPPNVSTPLVYCKHGIAWKQGEYHVMFNGIYPSSVCNLTSSIEIDPKKKKKNSIGNTPCRRENREESLFVT